MPLFVKLQSFLRNLFSSRSVDADLDQEVRAHLDMLTDENLRAGMSPEAAQRAARMELGGVEQVKEQVRDQRLGNWLSSILADSRFALRQLRKSPGFTTVAILTLALGIGATTAIFTLLNALLLRQLPVQAPEQLVELLHRFPNEPATNGFSGESFELLREHNHVFSGLIGDASDTFQVRGAGSAEQALQGGYVDGNFFPILGLQPAAGRLIGPEDDRSDVPSPVAVVSWNYWTNYFQQDRAILGKQIVVDNVPITIVGVAPRGFVGLSEQRGEDVWLPLAMRRIAGHDAIGWGGLALVGRLKPGVSIRQARAEMAVLFHSDVQLPNPNPFLRNMRFELEPAGKGLSSPLREQFTNPLLVILSLVSLLLLLACTNVASLLLARGAAKEREMALRVALGAGRDRLIRLVLAEPILLCSMGGLLGLVVAYGGTRSLVGLVLSGRRFPGAPTHVQIHVQPDLHVLLFTAGVTLLSVALSATFPVLRALTYAPISSLRQTGGASGTTFRWGFGKSLVVAQVALSCVLLSAAAFFIGYLSHLQRLNLGFHRDHLLILKLDLSQSAYNYAQLFGRYQNLQERLNTIPEVRSTTFSAMTPLSGAGRACYCVTAEGHPESIESHRDLVSFNWVDSGYFETYRTPLLAGRYFRIQDQNGPRVVIINQAMARFYFGELSPIGKHLTFDVDARPAEIVGVVGDAKYNDVHEAPPHTVYLNAFQEAQSPSYLSVSTNVDPNRLAPVVAQLVRSSLNTIAVTHVSSMTDQVDASLVPERIIARLSGYLGGLAGLLVGIGLFGLISFTVTRRISEIGIRMALGATRRDISRMFLAESVRLVCAGMAIGTPVAFWSEHLARRFFEDLPATNLLPIVLGIVTLLAVALFSTVIPARRAARVDPLVALRYE